MYNHEIKLESHCRMEGVLRPLARVRLIDPQAG